MPWPSQRVYLEGIRWEFYDEDEQDESDESEEDLTGDWNALAKYGINVQNV